MARINSAHHYGDKIVTQVVPFKIFYPAENYHQDYYKLNPNSGYILGVSRPRVLKLRKSMNALIKLEFNNQG